MQANIFILGIISLILWAFVWHRASYRSPLGWASPISLFAAGLLFFYIIPSLYWQFRPWNYFFPPYFEGLPIVLGSTVILGLPFFGDALLGKRYKTTESKHIFQVAYLYRNWWLLFIPLFIGIGWRLNLISIGWQLRLARDNPTLLGSEDLGLIANNFSYYYPAIYFLLIAFGNKLQRRIGMVFWIIDGFLQIIILARHNILRFVFISLVFSALLRWKITLRQWLFIGIFCVFVMSVIGVSPSLVNNIFYYEKKFMNLSQITELLKLSAVAYFIEEIKGPHVSFEPNPFIRSLDDTMYRLYDARSASAVMMNVPDSIPYFEGKTFLHIFYAFIPRYFWSEKPYLDDIHRVTEGVMYPEIGNPLGTVAELYMNYGLLAVLLGGITSFFLCKWGEHILTRKEGIGPVWVCMYPILAEQYIEASYNFTQRISECIHALMVIALIILLLQLVKKRTKLKT